MKAFSNPQRFERARMSSRKQHLRPCYVRVSEVPHILKVLSRMADRFGVALGIWAVGSPYFSAVG